LVTTVFCSFSPEAKFLAALATSNAVSAAAAGGTESGLFRRRSAISLMILDSFRSCLVRFPRDQRMGSFNASPCFLFLEGIADTIE